MIPRPLFLPRRRARVNWPVVIVWGVDALIVALVAVGLSVPW